MDERRTIVMEIKPKFNITDEQLRQRGLKPISKEQDLSGMSTSILTNPNAENQGIPGSFDQQDYGQIIADRQTLDEELGNAALRFAPKVGLQILETVGNIADLGTWAGSMGVADDNFQSWLTSWAKDKQQEVNEALPLFRKSEKVFDPSDSAWWVENGSSLLESVAAFGLTGLGMGAGIKAGIKGLAASAPWLSGALETSGQALSTLALTHAEGVMTGADVYKQTVERDYEKQNNLPEGSVNFSYQEVAQMPLNERAAEAAATSVRLNYFNAALNYTSLSPVFKKTRFSRYFDDVEDAAILRKGVGESLDEFSQRTAKYNPVNVYKKLQKTGAETIQESLEEGINVWAQNKGLAQAGLMSEEDASLTNSLFSEEGLLSMALGAVGGAAQTGLISLGSRGQDKQRIKEYNDKRNQILKNYGEEGAGLINQINNINTLVADLQNNNEEFDEQGVKAVKEGIIQNLALANFIAGTTSSLEDMIVQETKKTKEQLIAEKKLDDKATDSEYEDYINSAKESLTTIKEQEKIYNKALSLGKYISPVYTNALYTNLSLEKSLMNEIQYNTSEVSFLSGILASKANALGKDLNDPMVQSLPEAEEIKYHEKQKLELQKLFEQNQKELKEMMTKEYRKKAQKEYNEKPKERVDQAEAKVKNAAAKKKTEDKVNVGTPTVMDDPFGGVPPVDNTIDDQQDFPDVSNVKDDFPDFPDVKVPEDNTDPYTPVDSDDMIKVNDEFYTKVNSDNSFKGKLENFLSMIEDVDLEPSQESFDKTKMLINWFFDNVLNEAISKGYTTPESFVNHLVKEFGEERILKSYDTYIRPILTTVYQKADFGTKTLAEVVITDDDKNIQPSFLSVDVLGGEFEDLPSNAESKINTQLQSDLNNSLSTDGNSSRDTEGKLITLNRKLITAFDKLAYSSRDYTENISNSIYTIEDASDNLADKGYDQNVLSNISYPLGTSLIVRVVPESEFVPYQDKNGNMVSYNDINNEESLPIVVEKDGKVVGYIHTLSYITDKRVVDKDSNIEDNKKALLEFRRAIISSPTKSAKVKINSRTFGQLFTTKDSSRASERILQPKIAVALSSSSLSFSATGSIPAKTAEKLLNKPDSFIPGLFYHLAETEGKILAIPLFRIKLENETKIKDDINKVVSVFFNKDLSIADRTEYDATNASQLKDFLQQYLYLKNNLEDNYLNIIQSGNSRSFVDFDVPTGTLTWVEGTGSLHKLYEAKGKLYYSSTTISNGIASSSVKEVTDTKPYITDFVRVASQSNINLSANKLSEKNIPFREMQGDKLITRTVDYQDIVLQHSLTNIKEHRLPDGTVTAFEQKIIGLNAEEVIEKKRDTEIKIKYPLSKLGGIDTKNETKQKIKNALKLAGQGEGGIFFVTLVGGTKEDVSRISVLGDEIAVGKNGDLVDIELITKIENPDGTVLYDYKNPSETSTQTTNDIDDKKADIERRRQEELKGLTQTTLYGTKENGEIDTNITITIEKGNLIQIDDIENSNEIIISNGKYVGRARRNSQGKWDYKIGAGGSSQLSDIELFESLQKHKIRHGKVVDTFNYDAELAALNKLVENTTVEDSKTEEVTNSDTTDLLGFDLTFDENSDNELEYEVLDRMRFCIPL